MLIGKENAINAKLVEEISRIFPITLVNYNDLFEDGYHPDSPKPKIILLNLMDIGMEEEVIFSMLKKHHPHTKFIAVHCFQVDSLIQKTLERGYDHYISILNFSEEFQLLLASEPELCQE